MPVLLFVIQHILQQDTPHFNSCLDVAALKDYKQPVTKQDVRAFLGLAGYYCHFVPGFAQLTARISDLTRKEEPPKVNWTAQHEEDFQN